MRRSALVVASAGLALAIGALATGCADSGSEAVQAPAVDPTVDLAVELPGTKWRFVSLPGSTLVPEGDAHIEFGERVAGSTGCNSFFGSLALEGDTLTIGEMGMTRRMCAPRLADQEQRIVTLLQSARRAELEGDSLRLHCEGESEPVSLERMAGE